MDRDGTKDGYDLALLSAIADAVEVPVIASGGVGEPAPHDRGLRRLRPRRARRVDLPLRRVLDRRVSRARSCRRPACRFARADQSSSGSGPGRCRRDRPRRPSARPRARPSARPSGARWPGKERKAPGKIWLIRRSRRATQRRVERSTRAWCVFPCAAIRAAAARLLRRLGATAVDAAPIGPPDRPRRVRSCRRSARLRQLWRSAVVALLGPAYARRARLLGGAPALGDLLLLLRAFSGRNACSVA